MIEVEIKIPVEDRKTLERRMKAYGFQKGRCIRESDIYFNNIAYDLRKKDMALRIRSCADLESKEERAVITYKGPKLDSVSMTRKELETEIQDAVIGREIIETLGFYALRPVVKIRQYYHWNEITACLDQVENLGDFLELEIIVQKEDEREAALKQLGNALDEIGLDREKMTRTSYLSMLLS